MNLFPLFDKTGHGWRPFGLEMSQNRISAPTWSYAIEVLPPIRIIEIGTNAGGFTLLLGLHCEQIHAFIHSFDTGNSPKQSYRWLASFLPITFYRGDCFGEHFERIKTLIQKPGLCYVLCDGGNKPKEFNTFAEFLKPGDIIGAHDFSAHGDYWPWSEITLGQVNESVHKFNLVPFMQDYFDVAGWLVRQKV